MDALLGALSLALAALSHISIAIRTAWTCSAHSPFPARSFSTLFLAPLSLSLALFFVSLFPFSVASLSPSCPFPCFPLPSACLPACSSLFLLWLRFLGLVCRPSPRSGCIGTHPCETQQHTLPQIRNPFKRNDSAQRAVAGQSDALLVCTRGMRCSADPSTSRHNDCRRRRSGLWISYIGTNGR